MDPMVKGRGQQTASHPWLLLEGEQAKTKEKSKEA